MRLKPRIFRKPQLTHPLARGFVGYWLHNEGSGLITNDLSGNSNYGAITEATWGGDGLLFNGADSFANIGTLGIFGDEATDQELIGGTFIVRFKTTSTAIQSLFGHRDDEALPSRLELNLNLDGFSEQNTGYIDFEWQLSANAGMRYQAAFNTGFQDGNWHEIAITARMNTGGIGTRIWLDGVELTGLIQSRDNWNVFDLFNLDFGMYIGGNNNAGALIRPFDGTISDTKFYNRVLLDGEILNLCRDPYILFRQDPAWMGQAAAAPAGTTPKGPLTHPLYGPFAGPIAC